MSAVKHPDHYNTGKIEVWDAIEDWKLGFLEGNVVKYVARASHKGKELEDLEKAQQYLERRIAQLKADEPYVAEGINDRCACGHFAQDHAVDIAGGFQEEGSIDGRCLRTSCSCGRYSPKSEDANV